MDFYYEVSNSPTFNTDPFNPLIRLPFYLCALEKYMQYSLSLASRGSGFVAPNPMVGALVVAEGRIIGEGWHQEFGAAHAEVNALNNVKPENVHLLSEATLFVTLEPCNHFGKTPPCTEKIINSGIKKVVVGTLDPNPLVSGKGVARLRENAINVIVGILENDCRELNKFFFCFHEKKRPYITLKWAQSSDGFIAGENNTPIHLTNSYSDHLVQKMRAEHMAIFVGGRTILSDDPKLTNRSGRGKNPVRISLDTKNNFPPNLCIFNTEASSLIFNFEKNEIKENVEFIKIEKDEKIFEKIMAILFNKKINSILVEGGTETINSFVKLKMWEEMKIFITENKLSAGINAPVLSGKGISSEQILDNSLITRINA